ncbi:hypothetical protein TWF281_011006 [Arthrobotrys megalospora]
MRPEAWAIHHFLVYLQRERDRRRPRELPWIYSKPQPQPEDTESPYPKARVQRAESTWMPAWSDETGEQSRENSGWGTREFDGTRGYGLWATRFIDRKRLMPNMFYIQIAAYKWAKIIYNRKYETELKNGASQLDFSTIENNVYSAWIHALVDEVAYYCRYNDLVEPASRWLKAFQQSYRGFRNKTQKQIFDVLSTKVFIVERCLLGLKACESENLCLILRRIIPTEACLFCGCDGMSRLELMCLQCSVKTPPEYYKVYLDKVSRLIQNSVMVDVRLDFELE